MAGFVCANCDERFPEGAEFDPVSDILERVEAGEPMPAGECPKCGCLVHPADGDDLPADDREAVLVAAKRWVSEVDELDLDSAHVVKESGDGFWVRGWLYVSRGDAGLPLRDDEGLAAEAS